MFSLPKWLLPTIALLCIPGPASAWMSEIGDFFSDEAPNQWQDLTGPRDLGVWGSTFQCSYCTDSSTIAGLEKYVVFAHNLVYGRTPYKFGWRSRGFRRAGPKTVGFQSWYNLGITGRRQKYPVRVSVSLSFSQRAAIQSGKTVYVTMYLQNQAGIRHSIDVLVYTREDIKVVVPRADVSKPLREKNRISYSKAEAALDNALWAGEAALNDIRFVIARDAAYRFSPFVPPIPGPCVPTSTGVLCYR